MSFFMINVYWQKRNTKVNAYNVFTAFSGITMLPIVACQSSGKIKPDVTLT